MRKNELTFNTLIDSNCFHCEVWDGDICLSWIEVNCEYPQYPIDSTECCETFIYQVVDTSYVNINHGAVQVAEYMCGDFNDDRTTNMLDIVHYVNCLYIYPPGTCDYSRMDINCDEGTNMLDIAYYIAWLYQGGPPLDCCE